MQELSAAQKMSTYQAVIDNIARHDQTVARHLKGEYLRAAAGSRSRAVETFFDHWHIILITYPDVGRLRAGLQYLAETRSNWARIFLGNAPLIADSVAA